MNYRLKVAGIAEKKFEITHRDTQSFKYPSGTQIDEYVEIKKIS
jgi:hypothetical protein